MTSPVRMLIAVAVAVAVLVLGASSASAGERRPEAELWPIYPPYPYRAGHYATADLYAEMPPYVAISPSFYRRRFFMMAQERDRYRYQPHIFRGGDGYYGDDYMK